MAVDGCGLLAVEGHAGADFNVVNNQADDLPAALTIELLSW